MAGGTDSADESSLTRERAAAEAREPAAAERPERSRSPEAAADSGDGAQCMPCRGTGTVISNLGGASTAVSCPWCGGTGVRQPGVDAQQAWRERAGASGDDGH